ncbi:FAD-dependent oxidoreductase [Phycisphaerales bacterium AB-hyl4]|uniref:FAD-dependent oxidoreductase n=1 Tax=Natronomicrosphaera hydrolytica TaxID=3242702 RepID=A0ABV4U4B1_9BACT
MRCDVLVIGGGSAGLAAAVAAARAGAKVVLVERHGALGGMASAALVHSICGLYLLRDESGTAGRPTYANVGLATELAGRLIAVGGAWGPTRMGRVDVLMQHPPALACVADAMVGEAGVTVCLHSEVISVERAGERVAAVEVSCRGRRWRIEAEAVVDASGDGVVAAMGGLAFEQAGGERLQRPAFIFAMQDVAAEGVTGEARLRLAGQVAAAVRDGRLPTGALGMAVRGTGRGGEAYVTIDLAGDVDGAYDPTQPSCLSALEVVGRSLAAAVAGYLRAEAAGFERSTISAFPTRVGVRESRRVVGRYCLTAEDLECGAAFDDGVAVATWPRELRETARGARLRFPRNGRACDVPLRALHAAGAANLFMAGRCMSCDHEAQASVRVIGTCLATGEAAGLASATWADVGAVDAAAVRRAREQWVLPVSERWGEGGSGF